MYWFDLWWYKIRTLLEQKDLDSSDKVALSELLSSTPWDKGVEMDGWMVRDSLAYSRHFYISITDCYTVVMISRLYMVQPNFWLIYSDPKLVSSTAMGGAIQAMEEAYDQTDASSVQGWIWYSRRFFLHCLANENIACDVNKVLLIDQAMRKGDVSFFVIF